MARWRARERDKAEADGRAALNQLLVLDPPGPDPLGHWGDHARATTVAGSDGDSGGSLDRYGTCHVGNIATAQAQHPCRLRNLAVAARDRRLAPLE